MYSQNQEEKIILEYFKDHIGTLLSIGENDGKTFSNSLALIEKGWRATLVEPDDRALNLLYQLHIENQNVEIFPYAIDVENSTKILYTNAPHIKGDVGLLSTTLQSERERWNGLKFDEQQVETITVETLLNTCNYAPFDFISIDAEGMDLVILQQMDLSATSLVCVEHNGKDIDQFIAHGEKYQLKEIHRNGENIILGR